MYTNYYNKKECSLLFTNCIFFEYLYKKAYPCSIRRILSLRPLDLLMVS
jgi:hypothetical protein